MDTQEKTKRFGIWVILCACVLRLVSNPQAVTAWLGDPQNLPFLIYLETGRDVRFSASEAVFAPHSRESPGPWIPPAEKKLTFCAQDAQLVRVEDDCGLAPDLGQLMQQPLPWEEPPAVLILHTHTTESYTPAGEGYKETARYRTLDEGYNMLSIGDAVEEVLTAAGIRVIHDRQLHDYPSYNGSYVHARKAAQEILAAHPEIGLVLDLHRDAAARGSGQLRTEAAAAGQPCAQLMLVVGTNVSRPSHKNWQDNLALGLKLHLLLERAVPGIMRPLDLRRERFNQDLCPGALLVEVGAAGNTHAEALAAARILGWGILSLLTGEEKNFP